MEERRENRMKLAIITGASSGLGESFFRHMLNRCDGVMSISRRLLPSQQELAKEQGKKLYFLQRDFRNIAELSSIAEDIKQQMGQASVQEVVFINNAGVVTPIGKITEVTMDEIVESVHVNMLAPILLTRGVLKAFDPATTRINGD
jgi:benzil reductase ((S)-benzoin forming)